jgi:hypothetical protein
MIRGDVLQASPVDPNNWGGWGDYAVQLVGAGGIGLLLREIVKQIFARANKGDDNAVLVRADLRQQVAALITRVDTLDARVEAERQRANLLFAENAELKAENRGLRDRYHRLLSWLQGIESLPALPPYLTGSVEGPTAREGVPKPPELTP